MSSIVKSIIFKFGFKLCRSRSSVAHNPQEFAVKFGAFADEQANKRGILIETHNIIIPDSVRDLDDAITNAINKLDADLVIKASHVPGFAECIFASNPGYLAAHSKPPFSLFDKNFIIDCSIRSRVGMAKNK